MTKRVFEVHPIVRRTIAHLGDRGEQWLAELPDLIGELERRWSITVDESLTGGTAAFVARAYTADGQAAVLKLAIPEQDFAHQVRMLQLAQGHGYVRLLADDVERSAALLEALGPSLRRMGGAPIRSNRPLVT